MRIITVFLLSLLSAVAHGQSDARFVVYDTDANSVVAGPIKHPRADLGPVEGLPAHYTLAETIRLDRPVYDDTVERVQRDAVEDCAFAAGPPATCTIGWTVTALSQEEIEAIAARAADEAERQLVRSVIQDLRDGTGSNAQRLNRVERALARVLRDLYR